MTYKFVLAGTAHGFHGVIELTRDQEITASWLARRLMIPLWDALCLVCDAVDAGQLVLSGPNTFKLNIVDRYFSVTLDSLSPNEPLYLPSSQLSYLWSVLNTLNNGDVLTIESVTMLRSDFNKLSEWWGF